MKVHRSALKHGVLSEDAIQSADLSRTSHVNEQYRPRYTSGVPSVAKNDPRVNIQNDHGKSKACQVRQVLAAIEKKEARR